MTPEQLSDYRSWAAGVCGYSLEGHHKRALYGEYVRESADGFEYVEKESWRPDENIAQAMEVVDAVTPLLPDFTEWVLHSDGANYFAEFVWDAYRKGGHAEHESRCLALLTAARAAWDAMQTKEEGI